MKATTFERGYLVLLACILFFACISILHANADAVVLPAGTIIIGADSSSTLTEAQFLLTRDDMEAAANALADKRIDEKTIADLRLLSNDRAKQLANAHFWEVAIGVVSTVLGFVVGHYAK
jgi:hypothetical protein